MNDRSMDNWYTAAFGSALIAFALLITVALLDQFPTPLVGVLCGAFLTGTTVCLGWAVRLEWVPKVHKNLPPPLTHNHNLTLGSDGVWYDEDAYIALCTPKALRPTPEEKAVAKKEKEDCYW